MSDKEFYEGLKALRSELLFTEIVLKNGYDPNQPRVPAGVSTGGQWTGGGSNGGTVTPSKPPRVYRTEEELFAQPDSGAVNPLFDEIVETIIGFGTGKLALDNAGTAATTAVAGTVAAKVYVRRRRHLKKWNLGKHKSEEKWENRLRGREWSSIEVDETIKHGKVHNAPNKIAPKHGATRYENLKTGKSLVIDNKTNEILHLGKKGYDYD